MVVRRGNTPKNVIGIGPDRTVPPVRRPIGFYADNVIARRYYVSGDVHKEACLTMFSGIVVIHEPAEKTVEADSCSPHSF